MSFKYEVLVIENPVVVDGYRKQAIWTEVFDNEDDCERYCAEVIEQSEKFGGAHPGFVYTTFLLAFPPDIELSKLPLEEY